MLDDIIAELSAYIQNNIREVQKCDEYKAEFEKDGNWDSVFPCVLFRLTRDIPTVYSSAGKAIKWDISFSMLVACRGNESISIMNLLGRLSEIINAEDITVKEKGFRMLLRVMPSEFYGYQTGVTVYEKGINIEYWVLDEN